MPRRETEPYADIFPLSARPNFVALPEDAKDTTDEQLYGLFAGDVEGFCRELYALVQRRQQAEAAS